MNHTDAIYEFPSQLFAAHEAKTPTEYANEAYDRTPCGVWTAFVFADGTVEHSQSLKKNQDTLAYATRHFVGIRHGAIVEGSDAEFTAPDLLFPFSDEELAETWQLLEDLTDDAR